MRHVLAALVLLAALSWSAPARAATGCSLRNPHTDIRAFFPDYTDFVVQYVTFSRQNPTAFSRLGDQLRDSLDPLFESVDVPYTLYTVRQNGATSGYVYGTNQRGTHGNLQVIAITNESHVLTQVYLQTIRSPHRDAFLAPSYLQQLAAVPLQEWLNHAACYAEAQCGDIPVEDPTGGDALSDHRAIVRALAKLSLLRDDLLRPGSPSRPPSPEALTESIGNHEAMELSRQTATASTFVSWGDAQLQPEQRVALVQHQGRTTAYPLDSLRRTPALRDGPLLIDWSETTQTLSVLKTTRDLQPTADLLFDLRLLRDPATGTTWAGPLGRTVAGEILSSPRIGGLIVPAAVAQTQAPWATVWAGEPAPPPRARIKSPQALLIDGDALETPEDGDTHTVQTRLRPVVIQNVGGAVWALDAHINGTKLSLERRDGLLFDRETGSRWTAIGRPIDGPLATASLGWPVQALLPSASAHALSTP